MKFGLWDDVVEQRDGRDVVVPSGATVVDVIQRLSDGETPAGLANATLLTPRQFVGLLAYVALGDGEPGSTPSLVQSRPSRPELEAALSEPGIDGLFPKASRPTRLALSAGLLQMFEFWDASHQAAQEADDLGESHVSAYWHGIAHRREPDPGNASYWFRRVGKHGVFGPLGRAASEIEREHSGSQVLGLKGGWDPYAFIRFCGESRTGQDGLARLVQRAEMALLLEASIPGG